MQLYPASGLLLPARLTTDRHKRERIGFPGACRAGSALSPVTLLSAPPSKVKSRLPDSGKSSGGGGTRAGGKPSQARRNPDAELGEGAGCWGLPGDFGLLYGTSTYPGKRAHMPGQPAPKPPTTFQRHPCCSCLVPMEEAGSQAHPQTYLLLLQLFLPLCSSTEDVCPAHRGRTVPGFPAALCFSSSMGHLGLLLLPACCFRSACAAHLKLTRWEAERNANE